jgi:hypothetical protein
MIDHDDVLVQLIRLLDRILTPPPPPHHSHERSIVNSDGHFLETLLITPGVIPDFICPVAFAACRISIRSPDHLPA